MLRCLRLRGTSRAQILFDLCLLRGKNPLWLSNVSHSFFSLRESCLPMPPRVYLWMEMTLETPCTPLPRTTTRISFISWSLRITERRSKVKAQGRFERHWVFLYMHIYISVYIYMIRSEVWRRSSTWTWGFTKKVLFWFIGQQFGVNGLSAEEELQE